MVLGGVGNNVASITGGGGRKLEAGVSTVN